jgi:VanZ family protein
MTWRLAVESVGAALVWGVVDELHQHFVPGRTADLADLAADTVGALVATVVLLACAIIAQSARGPTGRRTGR